MRGGAASSSCYTPATASRGGSYSRSYGQYMEPGMAEEEEEEEDDGGVGGRVGRLVSMPYLTLDELAPPQQEQQHPSHMASSSQQQQQQQRQRSMSAASATPARVATSEGGPRLGQPAAAPKQAGGSGAVAGAGEEPATAAALSSLRQQLRVVEVELAMARRQVRAQGIPGLRRRLPGLRLPGLRLVTYLGRGLEWRGGPVWVSRGDLRWYLARWGPEGVPGQVGT